MSASTWCIHWTGKYVFVCFFWNMRNIFGNITYDSWFLSYLPCSWILTCININTVFYFLYIIVMLKTVLMCRIFYECEPWAQIAAGRKRVRPHTDHEYCQTHITKSNQIFLLTFLFHSNWPWPLVLTGNISSSM